MVLQSMTHCLAFVRDLRGVTAIEYAFIAALIAIVVIGAMLLVGGALGNLWNALGTCVSSLGKICGP